jgi:hypothetical protein
VRKKSLCKYAKAFHQTPQASISSKSKSKHFIKIHKQAFHQNPQAGAL